MSSKAVAVWSDEKAPTVVEEECPTWKSLHPDILSSIFLRMPVKEMLRSVPLVCKPWMRVVSGPYCWLDIDIQTWCRRHNRSGRAIDRVVKKLIRRSSFTVQRLSAYRMGEAGLMSVANCLCLEVLEIPNSRIILAMVLKHLKPLPNLKVLNINCCSMIKAKGIAAFGNQCKSLVHLKRSITRGGSSPVDDSEAKAIADTMPNLQRLELCFGRFGDSGLSEILTKCKSLTHLDIRGCKNVELNGDLKKMCEKLECFQIHHGNPSTRWLLENELEREIFPEAALEWEMMLAGCISNFDSTVFFSELNAHN